MGFWDNETVADAKKEAWKGLLKIGEGAVGLLHQS
jgi:hypothetical protein